MHGVRGSRGETRLHRTWKNLRFLISLSWPWVHGVWLWVQNPGKECSPKECPLPPPEHWAPVYAIPSMRINSPVYCVVRGLKGEVGGRGWWGSPECLDEGGEWGALSAL